MFYIVFFLLGAAAAASALGIWYFGYVAQLRRERQSVVDTASRLKAESHNLAQRFAELESNTQRLNAATAEFQARKVQYEDLLRENSGLKQDLFNLSVQTRKMERDHAAIARRQDEISQRTNELADRYLMENVAWIGVKLNSNNFASCKQRLLNVVGACRAIGFAIPEGKEVELIEGLKKEYEEAVRREFAREEQARIKAQIREEEKVAREREKAVQEARRKEGVAHATFDRIQAALAKARDAAEIERLTAELAVTQAQLEEAQENTQRAISNAEMTKSGWVYVLSNIGSFGENVFKVGMTRRDDPQERVDELGSASVPFEFDVHMMISCMDAPAVETALHRELNKYRVNRTEAGRRKEFFRVDLQTIRQIAENQSGKVTLYCSEPEAEQYRNSQMTTDDELDFIEHTHQSVMQRKDSSDGDE